MRKLLAGFTAFFISIQLFSQTFSESYFNGMKWRMHEQTLTIKIDPRVKTTTANLQLQHDLSLQCYEGRKECMKILEEIRSYRSSLKNQTTKLDELNKKDKEAAALESTPQGSQTESFTKVNAEFASIFNILQDSDTPPTIQVIAALKEANAALIELKKKWAAFKK